MGAFAYLAQPAIALLIRAHCPALVARAVVLFGFGMLMGTPFFLWGRASFKVLLFLVLTLTIIASVQPLLAQLLDMWNCPAEIQPHASWLAAIVLVGWPADLIRKRLGVKLRGERND
jgi:hypothetical protein